MFASAKAWTRVVTILLLSGGSAFAGSDGNDLEQLRKTIKDETTHQCLLGNFDFRTKGLRKQLELILTGRQLDMLSIKSCQTLGEEIGNSLTEMELQALMSDQGKTEALQERDQLFSELDHNPEALKQKGKISKVLANGVYLGLLEFSNSKR